MYDNTFVHGWELNPVVPISNVRRYPCTFFDSLIITPTYFKKQSSLSSIKDVSPKGEGGGYKKCPKKETFTSRFEETRGGRVPQKSKIRVQIILFRWPLRKMREKNISYLRKIQTGDREER